jgi:DNA-binding NarL/FixJ family response regulator
MTIRVLVVEDDALAREALTQLVRSHGDLAHAGSFGTAEAALAAVQGGLRANVALLDLGLPRMSGQTLIPQLRALLPDLEIVVLTIFEDDDALYGALRAGASGYLLKDASESEVAEAISQVHRGGAPMSPSIARRVLSEFRVRTHEPVPPAVTPREHEVLELLVKGASYPLIAKALGISLSTVQTHIRAIYAKLEVCTKAEATAEAFKRGLVR